MWDRVTSSLAYVRDMLASDSTLYPKFQVSIVGWDQNAFYIIPSENTGTARPRDTNQQIYQVSLFEFLHLYVELVTFGSRTPRCVGSDCWVIVLLHDKLPPN